MNGTALLRRRSEGSARCPKQIRGYERDDLSVGPALHDSVRGADPDLTASLGCAEPEPVMVHLDSEGRSTERITRTQVTITGPGSAATQEAVKSGSAPRTESCKAGPTLKSSRS